MQHLFRDNLFINDILVYTIIYKSYIHALKTWDRILIKLTEPRTRWPLFLFVRWQSSCEKRFSCPQNAVETQLRASSANDTNLSEKVLRITSHKFTHLFWSVNTGSLKYYAAFLLNTWVRAAGKLHVVEGQNCHYSIICNCWFFTRLINWNPI